MKSQLQMSIEGMHCAACIGRVTHALTDLETVEVQSVKVGSAILAYDSAIITPGEIVAAVNRIGFPANAND